MIVHGANRSTRNAGREAGNKAGGWNRLNERVDSLHCVREVERQERSEMSAKEIKVGDVVRLKGYKISMTVEKITEYGIECVWFDPDQQVQRGRFQLETIVKVENSL